MNRLKFIVLLALAIAGAIVAGPSSERLVSAQAPGAGDGAISADQLREWLTYIASDELEGRATFSEGLARAGAYIAAELAEAGVEPAGDNGTYFQRVRVLGVRSTNNSTLTVEVKGETRIFSQAEGIRFPSNVGRTRTLTPKAVEFVGYGLKLGEHDDYAGLDVEGKAVVWLGSAGPSSIDSQRARRLLRGRASLAADELGAVGTIAPPQPAGGGRGRGGRGRGAQPGGRGGRAAAPDFTTSQRLDRLVAPSVTGTDELFEFLFSASDVGYTQLKAMGERGEELPRFTLDGVTLTFNIEADYEVVNTQFTRNIVGKVEGRDTTLRDRYVAFGAHYDHVGYSQGVLGEGATDRISNGADDDGSGTTTLMGVARAFAAGSKPRRSLLFVWHAGEERGLWGSRYFADYPTVPIENVVANLNMDMIGRNRDNLDSEANTVYAIGSDRISTELHNLLVDANENLRRPLTLDYEMNDPADPERLYYRSDHYSYASKGIPIVFFTTGLHPDYHRVTDSVEKINFEKMTRIGELVYALGRLVANMDHAPARDNRGPRMGSGSQGKLPQF